jgi:hypothetical protein
MLNTINAIFTIKALIEKENKYGAHITIPTGSS